MRNRWRLFWRIVEVSIALFCLSLTCQLVWLFFSDGRLAPRFPNPTVWLIREDLASAGGAVLLWSPEPFEVKQPLLRLRGFGPPRAAIEIRLNEIHAGWIFADARGRFPTQPLELRRGLNRVVPHVDPGPDRDARPGFEGGVTVVYRAPVPVPPVFLGVAQGHGGPVAVGLGEPYAVVAVRDPRFPGLQSVSTDLAGAFQYAFGPDSSRPAILEAGATPAELAAGRGPKLDTANPPQPPARLVRVEVAGDTFMASFSLKLPAKSLLAEWVQQGKFGPRELLLGVFGLELYSRARTRDFLATARPPEWKDGTVSLRLDEALPAEGLGLAQAPSGALGFLSFPGDEVRLRADDPRRVDLLRRPDAVDRGVHVWRGSGSPSTFGPLFEVRAAAMTAAPPPGTADTGPSDLRRVLTVEVERALPLTLRRLLWMLAGAAPFIALLWIVWTPRPLQRPYPATLAAAALTFLIFHVTILSLPLFALTFGVFRYLAPAASGPILLQTLDQVGLIYPFFGIGILFLLRPIYVAYSAQAGPVPAPLGRQAVAGRILLCVLAPAIPVLLFAALVATRLAGQPRGAAPTAFVPLPDFVTTVAGFALVGLAFLPALLYWLLRVIVRGPLRLLAVVGAGWAMLLVPLAPGLLDSAAGSLRYLIVTRAEMYPWFIPSNVEQFLWFVIVTGIGIALLFQVTYLAVQPTGHARAVAFLESRRGWLLVLPFVILCLPLAYLQGRARVGVGDLTTLANTLDALLPFAILPGLIAYFRALNQNDDFVVPADARRLGALLFAFYLTGRTSTLLSIPVFLLAWFVFSAWLLARDAPAALPGGREAIRELVRYLLDYKQATRLAEGLRRNLEKKYTEGSLSYVELRAKLAEAERQVARATEALALDPGVAKQRIFGRGPDPGPWANAVAAVRYGSVLAIPFLATTFAHTFEGQAVGPYPLLGSLWAVLNSLSTWLLIAFLFGYFFHLIRGRDGFTKAVYYSAMLLVASVPVRLANPGQTFLGQGHLAQAVQIFAYALALALIAFDLRGLRTVGYTWRDLLSVHGLTTVSAYGSTIAITGAASLTGKDILPLVKKAVEWLAAMAAR